MDINDQQVAEVALVADRSELIRIELTKKLTEAMSNENAARVTMNKALSSLRAAEKRTKKAAEALGDHSQRQLGL